ncbi:hypothetical protein [Actinopolymorpha alba]|uniref:hypothetical protein n=1 Tax=Actinopolymorpha alba TaxID=533267 RepID=UPI000373BC75|nr:hypothetical protein [Actinopolymorpha alba]
MGGARTSGELFDGALAAFTSTIWFIEAPYDTVVEAIRSWRHEIDRTKAIFEPLRQPLEALLTYLEPWAMPSWKELIIATRGPWTALFSQGSDVGTFEAIAREGGYRSLRTNHNPHVVRDGQVVSYGDTALWLTDGSREDLGPLYVARVVQASNQDEWEWLLDGEPQPFEEPLLYRNRRIKDRFDLAALNRYCDRLGIERANPAFYGPEATLITRPTKGWARSPRTMTSTQWRTENS